MTQSRALAASLTGAIIGGIAGYLLISEQGQATRRQLERSLVDFSRELNDLRRLIEESATVVGGAWTAIRSALGERPGEPRSLPLDRRASAH
jgi:gas vesicle protein